jgi:probable phosphoglycerate mutase
MTESLFSGMPPTTPAVGGWFVAHCDGGSRGNPGPAGFGAVVEDPQGRVVARLSEYLGRQTNNFAEYSGLLAVLKWAIENSGKRLRVVSDSELMVKQMKGIYKVANPGLKPLWEEAKRLARQLDAFEISHTLRGGNKEADRLANDAMDSGMGKNREQGMGNRDQGTGTRDQRSGSPTQQFGPAANPAAAQAPKPVRQVFEGLVKNGVVHLIEGELPDGILVKVIRE